MLQSQTFTSKKEQIVTLNRFNVLIKNGFSKDSQLIETAQNKFNRQNLNGHTINPYVPKTYNIAQIRSILLLCRMFYGSKRKKA